MKLWEVHSDPERVPREHQDGWLRTTCFMTLRKVRSPESLSPAPRGRRGQGVEGKCHVGTMVGEGEEEALTVSCWKVSLEDLAVHLNQF